MIHSGQSHALAPHYADSPLVCNRPQPLVHSRQARPTFRSEGRTLYGRRRLRTRNTRYHNASASNPISPAHTR